MKLQHSPPHTVREKQKKRPREEFPLPHPPARRESKDPYRVHARAYLWAFTSRVLQEIPFIISRARNECMGPSYYPPRNR